MRADRSMVVLGVCLGLLFWVVDALLDFLVFYEDPFTDRLMLLAPVDKLFTRAVVLLLFIAFGIVVSWHMRRRQRADEALEKAEAHYRSLVENAVDMLYCLNLQKEVTYVSPQLLRALRYTREELLGRPSELFVAEEDRAKTRAAFERRMRGEHVPPYEFRLRRKDGSYLPVEIAANPIYSVHGRIVGNQVILRDVAERRQAEEALRESDREKALILGSVSEQVIYHDTDLKIIWTNRAAGDSVGTSPEQLVGRHCYEVWHQRDEPCTGCPVVRAVETGAPQEREMTTPDGRWWHVKGYPVQGDEGTVVGAVEVVSEITERKRVEEALRESEAKYAAVVEHAQDGVVIIQEGTVSFVNDALERISGLSREDLLGSPFLDFVAPESRRAVGKRHRARLAGAAVPSLYESKIVCRDGTVKEVEFSVGMIQFQSRPAVVAVVRDVAERKQAERELRLRGSAMASSINGIAIADVEGNLTYVNDSFLELWGYDDEREVLGAACASFWQSEEDARRVLEALRDRGSWRGELVAKRNDGSTFDVEFSTSLVTDDAGQPLCMMASCVDVTERKRAEEALRESEARLQDLFEESPVGYHELDMDGHIVRVNRTELDMLGYTAEEMQGRPVWEFVVEEDASRRAVVAKLAGAVPPGRAFERTCRRKGGALLPVLIEDRLLHNGSGRITGIRSTIQDITERKQTEDSREHHLEQLRRSLRGTIQAIALTVETRDPYTAGHQRRAADLARAIATEMGCTRDEIEGLRMAGAIHDLGKVSVPGEILSKPGRLTDIEFELIKTHPQVGYEILKTIEFPWPVALIVLQHHERLDGSGYPQGLRGEAILLEARILDVADVVEAMASHRPYRPARGIETALREISENRGILYDAEVVAACLALFADNRFEFGPEVRGPVVPVRTHVPETLGLSSA